MLYMSAEAVLLHTNRYCCARIGTAAHESVLAAPNRCCARIGVARESVLLLRESVFLHANQYCCAPKHDHPDGA